MSNAYVPKFLQKCKLDIVNDHPFAAKEPKDIAFDNEEIKEFLTKLSNMQSNKIEHYSKNVISLYPERTWWIVKYLVRNQYNLKLDNLFRATHYLADENHYWALVTSWEDFIGNKEVKDFIIDQYDNNEVFDTMLDIKGIAYKNFNWIYEDDVVLSICQSIKECNDYNDFIHTLVIMGIIQDTWLYNECIGKYLLVCDRDSYVNFGDLRLMNGFYAMKKIEDRILFLVNLCRKLSASDLKNFNHLSSAARDFKNNNGVKDKLINALTNANVYEKFNSWIISKLIWYFFESYDDQRRRVFWDRYSITALDAGNNDYALYIKFNGYYITEFKEQAGGCMYLVTEKYFNEAVKARFQHFGKNDFRYYMNDDYDRRVRGLIGKYKHIGEWEDDFRKQLLSCGINGKW